MRGRKNITIISCLFLMGLLWLTGCGSPSSDSTENSLVESADQIGAVDWKDMKPVGSMELLYAENFSVDYYEGGFKLLETMDGTQILVVPEDKEIPQNVDEDTIVLKQPVQNMYLVSSAVMDIFSKLDAIDTLRFSSQTEDNWYVDDAKQAMEDGSLIYAGKYSKPDYELIVSEGCSLAIENSMIFHSPEVMEMLESFDIPVMVEYSSYESHPMGRVEWIKFFGALVDKEDEAQRIFDEQIDILDSVTANENTDKTVAFFYITSNGLVQVRQSNDYIPKMIELAGGRYIFDNLGDSESKRSTMNMQVEEFYDGAKDADYIIYNSTIDGGLSSVDELIDKCPVLADFKAVKDGNVWCTGKNLFQETTELGTMIEDIHTILTTDDDSLDELAYMHKLK